MIKIHKPIEPVTSIHNGVFLAGPCPRTTDKEKWDDWRSEMTDMFEVREVDCEVINPTNENYDENRPSMYDDQCDWETRGMQLASVIVFWVDRNENHPALTTNIEFGIWSNAEVKRLVVGVPDGSEHCGYIKWVCKQNGIPCFSTMEEVVNEVDKILSTPMKIWFTSDTHFGSDRTLKYSLRPFATTDLMDRTLISNWNKVTTSNDIIYHLGDFGDLSVLPLLQFKKLVLVRGNYERDENLTKVDDPRVYVVDGPILSKFTEKYVLVHEPIFESNGYLKSDLEFFIYGHIHEKGKVKRNGFNVGIDANNYRLVDIDTIEFYKNAILNHYDDNVFTEQVYYNITNK